ncbi:MAG: saccharopine dehydrogenase family protein [Promethearchaeota archaeon]
MKLLVLGGAGDMGSYTVRDVAQYGSVFDEIIIGDINEKKSKKLIEELGDKRISFKKVNAHDHESLVSVMQESDVIVSAIGPFYIFGPKVVKAAIAAKKPIIDICDDYGPTQEVLKMDEEAKNAGVLVLLGYGWTPGLSNLLVRYGYNKLDKDDKIRVNIAWAGGAADSEGLAVIMHVLYAVDGRIPSHINGKLVDVLAGEGHRKVEFPEPLGTIGVFDTGHPEPVTIPKFLEGIEECTLKGGLTPNWNNQFAASMKQLHLIQGRRRKTILAKFVHFIEGLFAAGGVPASSVRVDLFGSLDGKPAHLVYATPSITMGELTGIPASIAAEFVAKGKITGEGVKPPETIEDPTIFFEELKKRGITMVFDDKGTPEMFHPPKSYKLGFVSRYGLTFLIVIIFLAILSGIIWILWLILNFVPNFL